MINKQERNFHYSHITRKEGPGITFAGWAPRLKQCGECKAEYIATSPNQHRCPTCQAAAKERRLLRANRKLRDRRRAARAAGLS